MPAAHRSHTETWWGYPKGVLLVAATELWERFSYWGLMAIFVLFLTADVHNGGLGWDRKDALRLYGAYVGTAFAGPLLGGWIANNYWGERRCIVVGGLLIGAGNLCLTGPAVIPWLLTQWGVGPAQQPQALIGNSFLFGLLLILVGTALIKPTISSIISHFFEADDPRREGAFGVFFAAIYVGCILGTFVVGFLGERVGWHWGFLAAAAGMLVSLSAYGWKQDDYLGDIGKVPANARAGWAALRRLTPHERNCLSVILWQGLFTAVYAAAFFQAGGFLLLFINEHVDRQVFHWTLPASWLINVATIAFVLLTPAAIGLWNRLERRGRNPDAPTKLAWGLIVIGCAYLLLAVLSMLTSFESGERLSWFWMALVYLCFGISDVLVWPNQLALTSRLAPRNLSALFIGGWYITIGVGTWVTGFIGAWAESWRLRPFLLAMALSSISLGCVAWILVPRMRALVTLVCLGFLYPVVASNAAQAADAPLRWPNPGDDFEVREMMIPMRDGIKLHTVVVTPRNPPAPIPILLQRTPYGAEKRLAAPQRTQLAAMLGPTLAQLEGYIFVFQDIRGRNHSEGSFVMERPVRGPFNTTTTDETTDAWDTVDWLVKNVPGNNGRVGLYGTSYDGWTVLMALIDPHPAVHAAVPVSPVSDMWIGDDWFHNGAFRMPYAFEYVYQMETNLNGRTPFAFDHEDSYVWWLHAGSASDVGNRYLGDERYNFWRVLTQHPDYDAFWQAAAFDKLLAQKATRLVPTLHVQGLFDQEDGYGASAAYTALEPRDHKNNLNFLVAGPWRHGQNWADGQTLAGLHWNQDTSLQWRRDDLAPFLDHFLKGGPDPHLAPVKVFNTGTREWEQFAEWPHPAGIVKRDLYLRAGGRVSWDAPGKGDESSDHYVSDPAKPVPYQPRPIRRIYDDELGNAAWRAWLAMDQRFIDGRPDVLTYVSEPLDQPVTVRGDVIAHLFAQTSGSDCDWVVKLIDVFPDQDAAEPAMSGYELMISGNILRARYRSNVHKPQPVAPNRTLDYRIAMPQVNHTFQRRHRLMVQIQSTWFPLYDRNPQTFVPNIMDANAGDYHAVVQTVHHGSVHPSSIELQVSEH